MVDQDAVDQSALVLASFELLSVSRPLVEVTEPDGLGDAAVEAEVAGAADALPLPRAQLGVDAGEEAVAFRAARGLDRSKKING